MVDLKVYRCPICRRLYWSEHDPRIYTGEDEHRPIIYLNEAEEIAEALRGEPHRDVVCSVRCYKESVDLWIATNQKDFMKFPLDRLPTKGSVV